MPNSYGDSSIPDDAEYGVYDSENGEWAGIWFTNKKNAEMKAAQLRNDPNLGVVSTTDEEDWL